MIAKSTALLDLLFEYHVDARSPLQRWTVIGSLYLIGAVTWLYFLGWMSLPLNVRDWADINVPRLLFVSNAIAAGEWPLHMLNTHSLHGLTDRFFCLPDVITTPQMLLLPLMGVEKFMVADVLFHYSLAVAALLVLRRRFEWSLFTFAVVFALLLFNGHILSHYSVGHFTWASYFLFPAVAVLVFELLDGGGGWRWVARLSGLLFYMVLAGGQHHFTWVLLLLAGLVPFCRDRARWILAAGVASGLLSAVRLLPPALALGEFGKEGWMSDVIGYPSGLHVISSMIELRRENLSAISLPLPGNFAFFEANYFEYSYFVGVVGAVAIFYFGVYRWLKERQPDYPQLIVPTLMVAMFSIGTVYRIVRATGVPLLMSERLVSRMLSLPMTIVILMAGIMLQKFIKGGNWSRWNQLTALALFGLLAVDLAGGVRVWRVAETARTTTAIVLDDGAGQLAHRDDPIYTRTLAAGGVITLMTAAGLLVLASRERRIGELAS